MYTTCQIYFETYTHAAHIYQINTYTNMYETRTNTYTHTYTHIYIHMDIHIHILHMCTHTCTILHSGGSEGCCADVYIYGYMCSVMYYNIDTCMYIYSICKCVLLFLFNMWLWWDSISPITSIRQQEGRSGGNFRTCKSSAFPIFARVLVTRCCHRNLHCHSIQSDWLLLITRCQACIQTTRTRFDQAG